MQTVAINGKYYFNTDKYFDMYIIHVNKILTI